MSEMKDSDIQEAIDGVCGIPSNAQTAVFWSIIKFPGGTHYSPRLKKDGVAKDCAYIRPRHGKFVSRQKAADWIEREFNRRFGDGKHVLTHCFNDEITGVSKMRRVVENGD